MKRFLNIKNITDKRGSLAVIEKVIPFKIKRVFFLYNIKKIRGEHAHKKNKLVLILISGSCEIVIKTKKKTSNYILNNSRRGLIIYPFEWHSIRPLKKNSIIMVFASHYFEKSDYIDYVC